MRALQSLFLCLCCALTAVQAHAFFSAGNRVIDIASIPDAMEADPYGAYLEDPDKTLTVEELVADPSYSLKFKSEGKIINRGYSKAALWIKLQLALGDHSDLEKREKVLQISYPLLDKISVYQVVDGKVRNVWNTGDALPFEERPVDHNSFLFPLLIEKQQKVDVYIRVESSSSLRVPLVLWDPIHFYQTQKSILLIDGLYYGILFLMFFYNLCLFLTVRDLTYLYYILYIVGMASFQSAMNGYGFEFIWPTSPLINNYVVGVSICGIAIFMVLFAKKVLETDKKMPRFDVLLKALIILQPVLIALCFILPYSLIIKPVILNALFSSIAMIVLGIVLATHNRTAKLFLVAWITMLVGAMMLSAASLGWIEANILTTNAFIFGSAIEVTLLSFTLAERMRAIQNKQTEIEKDAKLILQKANESLVDSNKLKDEFLATISHELRTPMNGVIGCLENIRSEVSDSKLSAYIDSADRSAQQMMLLVDGILTYTEIHSHGLRLDSSPFETDKLIDTLNDFYLDIAKAKGLNLNIKSDKQLPKLLVGDRRQLLQIISNLVDNAIKFTPKGFVDVSFDVLQVKEPQKTISLKISVTDSGIGINQEKSDLIFEKFRQADGSFHRNHGGLGIGLAICKELSDLMGAGLNFHPQKTGTQFTLTIEIPYIATAADNDTQVNEATGAASSDNEPVLPQGLTAIVVEDNPVNQMVLKGILKKLDFTVLTAENGQIAVDTLSEKEVDVILMDCQMPVMDGFEATRQIRKLDNANAHVPIIAVTANAMAKDRETCINAGMNDYLSKPVKAHQIRTVLSKWLDQANAA
ncbi:MAG: response regulator [Pseudomonadales bacterium]|nr:response regulator [Pseudomonadales bacterium]